MLQKLTKIKPHINSWRITLETKSKFKFTNCYCEWILEPAKIGLYERDNDIYYLSRDSGFLGLFGELQVVTWLWVCLLFFILKGWRFFNLHRLSENSLLKVFLKPINLDAFVVFCPFLLLYWLWPYFLHLMFSSI